MKGGLIDLIMLPMVIFVIALILVIAYYVETEIEIIVAEDPTIDTTIMNKTRTTIESFDYNFLLFIVLGLFGGVVITALFIPTHPIFIQISLLLLAITIFISAVFSNLYLEFFCSGDIAAAAANFGVTLHIMTNLPIWIAIFGGLAFLIALFLKSRGASIGF